jgi:hypothetical protein
MNKSESITKLAAALAKAQKNIGAASKGAANPFFKSKYADLGSVMEACKEALNAEGITVLQPVTTSVDGKHAVETVLLHDSGEFISSTMTLELTKTNMQDLGSAISYARRYSLQSLVFIPAEDDDAEKTMTRTTEAPKTGARKPASFAEAKKDAAQAAAPKATPAVAAVPAPAVTVTNGATNAKGTTAPAVDGWD